MTITAQSLEEFTVIIAGLVREGLTFEARTDAVNGLFRINFRYLIAFKIDCNFDVIFLFDRY